MEPFKLEESIAQSGKLLRTLSQIARSRTLPISAAPALHPGYSVPSMNRRVQDLVLRRAGGIELGDDTPGAGHQDAVRHRQDFRQI